MTDVDLAGGAKLSLDNSTVVRVWSSARERGPWTLSWA
jgi:hypothetical protein